jgi:hypothetical protein
MLYGTASYYAHLRFEPPADEAPSVEVAAVEDRRPGERAYLDGLAAALAGGRSS